MWLWNIYDIRVDTIYVIQDGALLFIVFGEKLTNHSFSPRAKVSVERYRVPTIQNKTKKKVTAKSRMNTKQKSTVTTHSKYIRNTSQSTSALACLHVYFVYMHTCSNTNNLVRSTGGFASYNILQLRQNLYLLISLSHTK